MTAGGTGPYRPAQLPGHDGFIQLLRSEWTKFRTVRGWVIGILVAALVIVLIGVLSGLGTHNVCVGSDCNSYVPAGPGGEAVTDSFYFVYQPLAGSGSLTVAVTALTGLIVPATGSQSGRDPLAGARPGLEPWSKAGIIIKASTRRGSAYAAMMVTGGHGVRIQYDYIQDIAGLPGRVSAASPRWLRLVRDGSVITGYDSADGRHWDTVGTARLPGFPRTVQAGMFAASPDYPVPASQSTGGGSSQATAVFAHIGRQGSWPRGSWSGTELGGDSDAYPILPGRFRQAGGRITVSGSGDIAPTVGGPGFFSGVTIQQSLTGEFAGVIAVIVVATMFITAEYRRGLIRTTFTASPRRGRVLAAKAIVIGAVTFLAGLAAAVIAAPLVGQILHASHSVFLPVPPLTGARIVAGTAALLAVSAVFSVAVGALLRNSGLAVTLGIAVIIVPYILATAQVFPLGIDAWVLRVTPAAAFGVQQGLAQYPQVISACTPAQGGCFPLSPWASLAVLCGYAALALAAAVVLVRRRDV